MDRWDVYALLLPIGVGCLVGLPVLLNPSLFEYTRDAGNIATRSAALAHGAPIWTWSDPPLRYYPIAPLILLGEMADASAFTIVSIYTFAVEFVLTPLAVYVVADEWGGVRARRISMLILTLVTIAGVPFWILPGWLYPVNPYVQGYWMYSYAIVPALLAWVATSRDRPYIVGVFLAVAALIQIVIAALAALIVAVSYAIRRRPGAIFRAAGTSMLLALPPLGLIAIHHWGFWFSQGSGRIGAGFDLNIINLLILRPSPEVFASVVGIAFLCLCTGMIAYRSLVAKGLADHPTAGAAVLVGVVLQGLSLSTLSFWYHQLIAYLFVYVGVVAASIAFVAYHRSASFEIT